MAYKQSFKKIARYWIVGTTIIGCFSLNVACAGFPPKQSNSTSEASTAVTSTSAKAVTALGRLEPKGETIKLSVANAQDSRVNKLLVEEGDRVKAGQVIAILQGLDKKQAELAEAQQNVAVYRAKLNQIEAGEAKQAEMDAQRSNVARLEAQLRTEKIEREAEVASAEAELRNARSEYQRYEQLVKQGAETAQNRDKWRKEYDMAQAKVNETQARLQNTNSTLQKQIEQENAMLEKLKEVRPVDVQVAKAELEQAIAKAKRIETELDDYYVRIPVDGQILKINTRVGEQVNTTQGIVELGRTGQMYAIAEVYETDVGKIKLGQQATVISEHGGFEGEVSGTVDHIGLQIKKQDVLASDPAAEKDARVVEVKVRIDPKDSPKVAGLTNLQVRITIDLASAVNSKQ
jgi:HlyD family secretion protein